MTAYSINMIKRSKQVSCTTTIKRKELTPNKLELFLNESMGKISIEAQLTFCEKDDLGIQRYTLAETKLPVDISIEGAVEIFEQYNKKLERRDYVFYVSEDGRSKIEWS